MHWSTVFNFNAKFKHVFTNHSINCTYFVMSNKFNWSRKFWSFIYSNHAIFLFLYLVMHYLDFKYMWDKFFIKNWYSVVITNCLASLAKSSHLQRTTILLISLLSSKFHSLLCCIHFLIWKKIKSCNFDIVTRPW